MMKIPEHRGFGDGGPGFIDQVATGTGESQVSDIGDWRHPECLDEAKMQGAGCSLKLPYKRLDGERFFDIVMNVLDGFYRHLPSGGDFTFKAASGGQ